jgi:uncharacterized protein (TIGR02453 family)
MKKIIPFLRKVARNNSSEWMKIHRDQYLEARAEFEFLVQELITRLSLWDDRFMHLEPKNCIFRLNRDVRFSDNKKPYKENFAAFFGIGGKKSELPGYYISLSPKEIFVGGGLWHPESDKLLSIRKKIRDDGEELEKIILSRKFKSVFGELSEEDKLKRVPRGFEVDHPQAELLKLKSIVAARDFTIKESEAKGFGQKVDKVFQALRPLNEFLELGLKNH